MLTYDRATPVRNHWSYLATLLLLISIMIPALHDLNLLIAALAGNAIDQTVFA
jgi:hypothetical protein